MWVFFLHGGRGLFNFVYEVFPQGSILHPFVTVDSGTESSSENGLSLALKSQMTVQGWFEFGFKISDNGTLQPDHVCFQLNLLPSVHSTREMVQETVRKSRAMAPEASAAELMWLSQKYPTDTLQVLLGDLDVEKGATGFLMQFADSLAPALWNTFTDKYQILSVGTQNSLFFLTT